MLKHVGPPPPHLICSPSYYSNQTRLKIHHQITIFFIWKRTIDFDATELENKSTKKLITKTNFIENFFKNQKPTFSDG